MGYRNVVVLVVKDGVEIPDLEKLKEADDRSVREGHQHWLWDWTKWEDDHEVPKWLKTVDEENWLLLRDGENDDDFEVTGMFHDCGYRIGFIIPKVKEETNELS